MSDAPVPDDTAVHAPGGPAFWVGLVLGSAVMAFGVRGLVNGLSTDSLGSVGRWVVGADLVHDLVLAPVVVLLGAAVGRRLPERWRAPIQVGLVATGIVLLVGWVPWRGDGRALVPDNPSVQPSDYTSAILTVLAAVWLSVGGWLIFRLRCARRESLADRTA